MTASPPEGHVNRPARWALGLGIASIVPGLSLAAAAMGVVGVLHARRSGGRGLLASVVGLALAAVFLTADTGLAVAGTISVVHRYSGDLSTASSPPSPEASPPQGGGGGDPDDPPDPAHRSDDGLSATEQSYVDDLDAVTYLNFDDTTLVAMGHLACRDFDAGRSTSSDSTRLGDKYGAGVGDAWDVQKAATKEFCPQHAGLLTDTGATGSTV